MQSDFRMRTSVPATTLTLGWSRSLTPLAPLAFAILEVKGERKERQALGQMPSGCDVLNDHLATNGGPQKILEAAVSEP